MIEGLSVLAVIPARGGSQGLARKNLREVAGRSLLARAIAAGRQAATVDRVILSSDDAEIIQAALLAGCEVPFVRPAELATAEARSIDALRHALRMLPERYDLVALLQPTSPLRASQDVDGAVRLCVETGAPACVSVSEAGKTPFWMHTLDPGGRMRPILPEYQMVPRRQDLPAAYDINGAVFVARSEWLFDHEDFLSPETVGYVMPKERSIDIDDELDLIIAEAVAQRVEGDGDKADTPATPITPAAGRGRASG